MSDLEARLLAAHGVGDKSTLVALYREAADCAGTEDEVGFFLTHAYIYALEQGHAVAPELRRRLVSMGRESHGD